MIQLIAAIAISVVTVSVLIFAAVRLYKKAVSAKTAGRSYRAAVGRLRRLYNSGFNPCKPWMVVYVSIYSHRLKSTVTYSQHLEVERVIEKHIEKAVDNGLFEAFAVLDGNNYVLLTASNEADVRRFCESFMSFADDAQKNSFGRYASLLNIHIGAYRQTCSDVEFDDAVDKARHAARYAFETGTRFCFSNQEVQLRINEIELLEKNVDSLIANNEFYMVIQPFIDRNGGIIGGEVLSRFRPMAGHDISLYRYLRAIGKMSLSAKFDYAVFEKCLSWQAGRNAGQMGIITCNFTRFTVSSADFLKNIDEIRSRYNADPRNVGIEITEDDGEINRETLLRNIHGVKERGFLLFVDDFGSGCASLGDVYSMPIDVLKLDKELLHETDTENGRIIFDSVCAMAKKLGISFLCEGIETAAHAAICDKADCDIRQGYYYYRPMLISEYEELYAHPEKTQKRGVAPGYIRSCPQEE